LTRPAVRRPSFFGCDTYDTCDPQILSLSVKYLTIGRPSKG